MANYDNQARTGALGRADVGAIDQGLRAYMLRVYNYMLLGLAVSGGAAWAALNTPLGSLFFQATVRGYTLSVLGWVALFAPLGMILVLGPRLASMSLGALQFFFWAFSALMGLSLAPVLYMYTSTSVAQVFFITAGTFGAMSLWGYTTQRDLTGVGSFLIMGLFGLIIASFVNIFLGSPGLNWVISIIGVLIFTGLTAFDTQKIKEMYYVGDDGTVAGRKAIMGALNLYLDFINLFQFLLSLLGGRRD